MAAPQHRLRRRPDVPELQLFEESDELLLRRIARGDQSAFEALYRRYARAVFGMALGRLRDHGRAEDAVQEAFTAIWRAAARGVHKFGRGIESWRFAGRSNKCTPTAKADQATQQGRPGCASSSPSAPG